jgi:hypothetical protein
MANERVRSYLAGIFAMSSFRVIDWKWLALGLLEKQKARLEGLPAACGVIRPHSCKGPCFDLPYIVSLTYSCLALLVFVFFLEQLFLLVKALETDMNY